MKETDLAEIAVAHLRDMGWDVHTEVGGSWGPRVDILAVRGPVLYAIEVKTTMSLELLGQAHNWLDQVHYVSVLTPAPSRFSGNRRASRIAHLICAQWGIGVLHPSEHLVQAKDWRDWKTLKAIETALPPRLHRKPHPAFVTRIRDQLCDGTRTFAAAGNAEGKFWSPFKATVDQIQKLLKERPGLTTREVVDAITHHYSSDATARGVLPRWLIKGKIPGVEGRGERPMRWYLAEVAAA